jgi:hypothetical protein
MNVNILLGIFLYFLWKYPILISFANHLWCYSTLHCVQLKDIQNKITSTIPIEIKTDGKRYKLVSDANFHTIFLAFISVTL